MLLRDQVGGIILGAVFLFIGLAACGTAVIRGRGRVRILLWFGILNTMYGTRILAQVPAAFRLLPRSVWNYRTEVVAIVTYLILIPALLFWLDLSLGKLRRFLQFMLLLTSIIASAGIFAVLFTDVPEKFLLYNSMLAICILFALAVVNAVPSLANRFGIMRSRISALGTLVLALAAIYANLKNFLHTPSFPFLEPLSFAVFVFSMGYVAANSIFADQRRLLSIESELAIARDIQSSTLPLGVPELETLRISATYLPMTAVAGDFYDFIVVDQNRIGFLVADVSGHGVPAALIAAMVKVAIQSVVSCAHQPSEVLRRLNRILSSQLRGQFITAAYLWLDTGTHQVLYSAAGHPPLLLWRQGTLTRIESNGLLFGVIPDADYPTCELPLHPGDRFLLYTDGIVEPENAAGESFGDNKLEEVICSNQSRSPSDLSEQLLTELRRWLPASTTQQDDITLIVIDAS
jgi:sigma-B regulation protein RsbU (phosphoserine phosphatase)